MGDAFGEQFFGLTSELLERIQSRRPPQGNWYLTDDSIMAHSITRELDQRGRIDPDSLATAFANAYHREPLRGYGRTAHLILTSIFNGVAWQTAASKPFEGTGSCGNGGAMRSAPIGAYFAEDTVRVIHEARLSAQVTHGHPDGQTGAIAVALAAAWMVRERGHSAGSGMGMIEVVLEHLPHTEPRAVLKRALDLPLDLPPVEAALELGSGSQVISSDTVPYCLWCACRHAGDYAGALWNTLSGFGDLDTTCAIVGGIVACGVPRESFPETWLAAREPLPCR